MTKKEFVQQVSEALKASPRPVLAGHGIPMVVLKQIASRFDIIAKLATILWSTKFFKKGAKGLKKAPGFLIKGYKNYKEFINKAPMDTQAFMESLSEKDMENFNVNNNVITFVCIPDDKTSGDNATDLVGGKSIVMEYTKALKKEYRIPGCFYINVYWADSIVRPAELRVAKAKEKVNKRKYVRRTRTKILAEIKKKAQYKLKKIAEMNTELETTGIKADAALQQFNQFGKALGFDTTDQRTAISNFKKYDAANRKLIRSLSVADKKLYEMAVEAIKNKDERTAKLLLKKINNPEITALVLGEKPMTLDAAKAARVKALRKQAKAINDKNAELLNAMENAPSAKIKANLRFRIKENQKKILAIRSRIATLQQGFGLTEIKNKAKLIAEVNAAMEANNAKGMSIKESLKNALAKLNIAPQQKEQIRQQVIEEIAEGMPTQVAVQSAIQSQIINPTNAKQIIEETINDEETGADELDAMSNDTVSIDEVIDEIENQEVVDDSANDLTIDDIINEIDGDETDVMDDASFVETPVTVEEESEALEELTDELGDEPEEGIDELEDTSLAGSNSISQILKML